MMKGKKLLCALLLASLALSLAACGAGSLSSGSDAAFNGAAGEPGAVPSSPAEAPEPDFPTWDMDGGPASSEESYAPSGGSYYENTKVILTADLSLQATDFDAAVAALDALVTAQGGYYESSEYSYGGYYSSGSRWGYFTVRVPRERYQAFLSAVGDVAHLVSRNTGTRDVGETYYDAELRLATLKTKHERLLELLDRAELMEDIIALESALSDVEYEIQQYSSTLKRYDGLIDFATVHLDLQEVVRVTDNPTEADPLSTRIAAAFTRGWHSFCDGMADFAVWSAYNFIGIVLFLAVLAAVIAVLLRLRTRRRKSRSVFQEVQEEPKDKMK